ncbi:hypothetical protein HGRIS_003824 [Hohenbuehelia grisea]|uniref:Histidinol-phosphatase n=1 Tax=Hohenbuehelia grisea TaxID=104357 RepID=A0ABR3JH41_9AGAR
MPYSHHSHSGQFCKHALGTLEEVVQEAIRQGFEVFGLTEHVPRHRQEDLYPEELEAEVTPAALVAQFEAFLVEAHRLKAAYAGKINLVVGLETEYISPLDLDRLDVLLQADRTNAGRIEFLVGSVHHVNGIPIDFDKPTFEKALNSAGVDRIEANDRTEAFLCAYFDAQYEILRRFHPEVIGHIDLCRLYTPELRLRDHPQAWTRLERNVTYAAGYGALFELNAAAFRKGWSTAYPGREVVEMIQRHGGRFTISDDSHGPHAVGLNYHRLAQYMHDTGIRKLWYLQGVTSANGAGRMVAAVEADSEWSSHPYWQQLKTDG